MNKKKAKGFTCWNCGKYHKFGTTWCPCGAEISEDMTREERARAREREAM
jgi:hypothetical protein